MMSKINEEYNTKNINGNDPLTKDNVEKIKDSSIRNLYRVNLKILY